MSNDSPVVNGENTSGNIDFKTDASLDMVAAIRDHNNISCGKSVPVDVKNFNQQDSKEGILAFSCEYDHMYASLTEGTELQKDNVELTNLKELLLLHLDLIQQQSEQLVNKDKQISALRQENETLRQRLERMDRRVTLHKHRDREVLSDVFSSSSATGDNNIMIPMTSQYTTPGPSIVLTIPTDEIKQEVTAEMLLEDLENMDNCRMPIKQEMLTPDSDTVEASTSTTCFGMKRKRKDDDRESDSNSNASHKRKRAVSWTSSVHSDMVSVSDERRSPKDSKGTLPLENKRTPKKAKPNTSPKADVPKPKDILTTNDPYYTFIGDPDSYWGDEEPELECHTETEAAVQVPSWRLKSYNSCYTMEGTENLDDEVFNKRHSRLEIDERRRKRWDVQRIREQRQVEKLKQRESSRRSSVATRVRDEVDSPKVHSFWPHVDDLQYLEVTDILPVAAFGLPISEFRDSEFTLPWLMYVKTPKKPEDICVTPKTNRRRSRPAVKSRR